MPKVLNDTKTHKITLLCRVCVCVFRLSNMCLLFIYYWGSLLSTNTHTTLMFRFISIQQLRHVVVACWVTTINSWRWHFIVFLCQQQWWHFIPLSHAIFLFSSPLSHCSECEIHFIVLVLCVGIKRVVIEGAHLCVCNWLQKRQRDHEIRFQWQIIAFDGEKMCVNMYFVQNTHTHTKLIYHHISAGNNQLH